jgi:hypothetical protein
LIDGTLHHAISHDENGNLIATVPTAIDVWTSVGTNGTAIVPTDGNYCEDWTTNTVLGLTNVAGTGAAEIVGSQWTDNSGNQCHIMNHLYCFGQ